MKFNVQTPASEDSSRGDFPIDDWARQLGIAGFQKAVWEDVMDMLLSVHGSLDALDVQHARQPASPLLDLIRSRRMVLAAELDATNVLKAGIQALYRTLSPRQQTRADRLLSPHILRLLGG